jgi:hypothetical protein
MNQRVAFPVCLDTTKLLLVRVLEPIKLTGLEWHQWLGFALCPLMLLHVVMQWQWFLTRGFVTLLIASLAAGATYFVIKVTG